MIDSIFSADSVFLARGMTIDMENRMAAPKNPKLVCGLRKAAVSHGLDKNGTNRLPANVLPLPPQEDSLVDTSTDNESD